MDEPCPLCSHPGSYYDEQGRCHAPIGLTLSDDCGCGWEPELVQIVGVDDD